MSKLSSNLSTDIIVSIEFGNVCKIVLNRPLKKNALSKKMYREVTRILNEADKDDSILICCLTGAGEYFTSGNDLNNFMDYESTNEHDNYVETFVEAFINFSKPLIALVNGPAVGIGLTILPLCDLVYSNEKATFLAPFTNLGLAPEACSSFTFPVLMGTTKANEILMFNRKLTAIEAYERNVVTEVLSNEKFESLAHDRIKEFSKLPRQSLIKSKIQMRSLNKELLLNVNKQEMRIVEEQIASEEVQNAIFKFMKTKSKL